MGVMKEGAIGIHPVLPRELMSPTFEGQQARRLDISCTFH